ncbi:MAG: hypothetical protein HYZ72_20850 [Deltaproteobacteria bacterium]|nr:hypothetical protein [Deltaproteobacteria bacterium]
MIEAMISREKGRTAESVQQRNDFTAILHSRATDFNADLPKVDLASASPLAFNDANIFVQDIHAARRRLSDFSIRASLNRNT